MQTTVPTPAHYTHPATVEAARARVTPLARIALEAGVSFDDVQAYCESRRVSDPELAAAWYEALVAPPEADHPTPALLARCRDMRTDTVLEGALLRSVLATGSIAHARVWWHGAL